MTDDDLAASLAGTATMAGTAPGRQCRVGRILETVDPANRDTIQRLLTARVDDDRRYAVSADDLAARLTRGGHPVGASTITRHRLGRCPDARTESDPA